jgi:uncharacterized phiE125 gp8 family phage protein
MRVVVVTPPDPIVSWEEIDAHLRLDGDAEQKAYVEALVAAATAHIDGPAGWLGRALGPQTLEARFHLDTCPVVRLPYGPVIDLISVKYLDALDVERTADLGDVELFGTDVEPTGEWPWIGGSVRREAGRIRYRAGYAKTPLSNPLEHSVPAPIIAAILLMTGDLYANRETAIAGSASAIPMSTTVENLLSPYQVWR